VRPDGSIRWIRSQAFPVKEENGRVERVAGLAEDITTRKLAEQLRDDLTHTLVHDLRNPLTTTAGFLEHLGLSQESLSPTQREMLGIAERGISRALTLVNDILDVSRLEAGAMPLHRTRAALPGLASEALDLQRPHAGGKGIRLVADVGNDLPEVLADVGLVGRVLQNLVGNAVKFTPRGGEVRLSASVKPDDLGMLKISVADTGPGIPIGVKRRLFEKFAVGHETEAGTGLGLAFCRLAVEAHGGRIWAEEGRPGALLVFTLPVASAPEPLAD
jgi:signal transduction histidine kinase